MRYIGSKAKVINFIGDNIINKINNIEGKVFADLFTGTTSVSKYFKTKGCKIISNDYMVFSYAFQIAYIKLNKEPSFSGLKSLGIYSYTNALDNLNNCNLIEDFFYKNYTNDGTRNEKYKRNYFSEKNAKKIDSILDKIETWKKYNYISFEEEMLLKSSLIDAAISVSNISGTYGAFLKVDDKRKNNSIILKKLKFIDSKYSHICSNKDILKLITEVKGDILYLDPPYNQRQYPPYYHILETLTLNDSPSIYGKTGRRPYKDKLSAFCTKRNVKEALDYVINKAQFEHIFLSYNSQGILTINQINDILKRYGKVEIFTENQRPYKSNNNGNSNKSEVLKELLFYVRK
jgi:adenine-specific DNA-methyltransferase